MPLPEKTRQRRELEKEARRLIRQWLMVRKDQAMPPDRLVPVGWHKRKAWIAPFRMGTEKALILSNGAMAAKGAFILSHHIGAPQHKRAYWVIFRLYSDFLSTYRLHQIVESLKADLAVTPDKR